MNGKMDADDTHMDADDAEEPSFPSEEDLDQK